MYCEKILYLEHAEIKMRTRHISTKEVENVLLIGKTIAVYPDDKPLPCQLVLDFVEGRPIHVLVAKDEYDIVEVCYVITVYEPTTDIWESDFKTKKEKK